MWGFQEVPRIFLTPRAPLKLSSAPHICMAFLGSPCNFPSWSCHQQALNLAARPQSHQHPWALCSVRVSRHLTKLIVFPGLAKALIFGSDAPHPLPRHQVGDETGTRWAASTPVGMGMLAGQALGSVSDLMALTSPSQTMMLRQNLGPL